MWLTFAFSAFLLLLSLAMLAGHWTAWRAADHGGLSQRELQFHRRRFHRRTLASGMIGVLGLLMAGGMWIQQPTQALAFWCGIVFLLGWLVLLALLDVFATRTHFSQEEALNKAELAVLQAEIRKFQEERKDAT